MRILLTNDDGIRARGIGAMFDALVDSFGRCGGPLVDPTPGAVTRSPRSTVMVVAPENVQSATSHGVTFHTPLMVQEHDFRPSARSPDGVIARSVDGRPADCVKLAISQLWPERFGEGSEPDLLVSGLNAGANCGINVIYSGTVAAALEGAFLGVPSIAVSLHLGRGRPDFDVAAHYARVAIDRVIHKGLPAEHECININIPITEQGSSPENVPPIVVCPMNTHGLVDKYERRVSPGGDVYYWAAGHGLDFHATERGSDVDHLMKRCITVTPLWYDLTSHGALEKWRARLGG